MKKILFCLFYISILAADLPLPSNVKVEWGFLPLQNKEGKEEANLFFTAYFQETKAGEKDRPLTICLNGGPGASSAWLHLGGVGPIRLKEPYTGSELEKNPASILPFTDLVFLDPLTTGLSRTTNGTDNAPFLSFDGDIESLSRAIPLLLNRFQKWGAPFYLMGESYGTLRIVGLAGKLFEDQKLAPQGLIFVSGPLDYQSVLNDGTSDFPYIFSFPTQAILAGQKKGRQAADVAREAEAYLEKRYQPALFLGSSLPTTEWDPLATELSNWTTLPKEEILKSFFRISGTSFRYHFESGKTVGNFDGRQTTVAPYEIPPYFHMEPSFHPLMGNFQQGMHILLKEIGWKGENEGYIVLSNAASKWDFGTKNCYLNVSSTLKRLLYQLPAIKVLSCNGWYDLGVPYYGVKYSLRHLLLDPVTAKKVHQEMFEGGHMFYLDRAGVGDAFFRSLENFYR